MPPKKAGRSTKRVDPDPPKPVVLMALRNAVSTMPDDRLRSMVIEYCQTMPALREALEKECLVQGKDIVRYYANVESEDAKAEKDQSSETEESDDKIAPRRNEKQLALVIIADIESAPRFAKCSNCKEDFDVLTNKKGDYTWHTRVKEINFEEDYWADHNVEYYGDYSDFEDDPDIAEGFLRSCCGNQGDFEGCKSTKHKALINIIVKAFVVALNRGQKRKAEKDLPVVKKAKSRK